MADGGMPKTHAVAPVPMAFREPLAVYEQASGPCDVDGEWTRTQLQELRYGIQLWTFTVAAPGADAIIAAGTERRTFAEGIQDVGTNLGWGTPVLTQAQTNLYPNGSLNNSQDGAFVARSLGFGIQRPFVYNSTTGERTFSDVVDAYAAQAARALAEAVEFSMLQRDNNLSLNIGLAQLWPGAQQIKECAYPTINEPLGAAAILPLRRDYIFVDDNQGSQNFLVGSVARQIRIVSDPANPIPAGFSVPIFTAVYGEVMSQGEACAATKSGKKSIVEQVRELVAMGYSLADAKAMVLSR